MSGVLFEGGSFRPVFSCGVMDALLEEDIMFPYVIGVSAGAADAASYISRQPGRNIEIAEKYRNDKRYVGKRNFIKDKSIFGIQFAFREIPNKIMPFDMKTFQEYEGQFIIVVTEAETGKVHYFSKEDVDTSFDAICATCALPVLFPAIEIQGKKYYDGGLANPIPIDKVLEDGNEKALVVLTRPKGFEKTCGKSDRIIARMMQKKYPKIAHQIRTRYKKYNESVAQCEELERQGRVIIIRPDVSMDSYETDVSVLRKFYEEGYKKAKENMENIKKVAE